MRKISAQYIFDGKKLHKHALLILNSQNEVIECIEQYNVSIEQEGVEFYNGIICPGFINAHCHLELSHLHEQIPMHTQLPEFISQIISKRNAINQVDEKMIIADKYMRQNGIVAVGDISNVADSFKIKNSSPILYHTFLELFDLFDEKNNVFEKGKELFKQYFHQFHTSLSPHAPYSCSRSLIERISEHAKNYEYPITIHNQEHVSENGMYQSKSGELLDFFSSKGADFTRFNAHNKSSLQTIAPWFPPTNHVLFVHNIYTNADDINFLKNNRTLDSFTFVVCPLSNKYIADVMPPYNLFIQHGVSVAIGTDSLASNSELSILSELLCLQNEFQHIPLQTLLQCATYNGAKALQIQKKYGRFKPGASPGVLLLENVDLQNLKLQKETKVRVLV